MLPLVETRPLDGSQRIPAEPLRRDRSRVEIQAQQLGTDQQPSVRKVAVRNRFSSNRFIDNVNAGVFLPEYIKKEILDRDPFQSLDIDGVGQGRQSLERW